MIQNNANFNIVFLKLKSLWNKIGTGTETSETWTKKYLKITRTGTDTYDFSFSRDVPFSSLFEK